MGILDRFTKKKPEEKPMEIEPGTPVSGERQRWQVGDKILNLWEVLDIKVGGMGLVYIIHRHESTERFAIKTYQDQFLWDEDAINRFMREAESWVSLERHTNIVFANFVVRIEGKPYIFLEYVDGGDLESWVGRISIPQALDFAIQFCMGMAYAYKKLGVIHRDIKPGNIMITKDKVAKVTDFGLASSLGERTGKLDLIQRATPSASRGMGTLPYMPPEQFSEDIQRHFSFKPKPITTGTDIYSFGMTFYYLLTGKLPTYASGDGDYQIISKVFSESPTNPMQINPEIPKPLDGLLMKCLEKNPEDRYKDFQELGETLIGIYNDHAKEKYVVRGRKEDFTAGDWERKGSSLLILGKFDQAIEHFDKALRMDPKLAEVWVLKGASLISLGRFKETLECCDKAIEINPRYAEGWSGKAFALKEMGRNREAIECCDKGIGINPEDATSWFTKGTALANMGKHKEAIECYDRLIRMDPRNADAWDFKGWSTGNLGRYEEAIEYHDKALSINPRNADAWHNKGAALTELRRHEEAIECYDSAIKIKPELARAWGAKGLVLGRLGRHQEAVKCEDKALEIDPTLEVAKRVREICLKELKGQKDKTSEIHANAEAWVGKGSSLLNQGKFDEAMGYFDKALKMAPREFQAWTGKGICLLASNKFNEAIRCFDKALEINPSDEGAKAAREQCLLFSRMKPGEGLDVGEELRKRLGKGKT